MEKRELKEALLRDRKEHIAVESEKDIGHLWSLASDEGESKDVRKRAKRALYVLRSKGIDVDSVKPKMKSAALPKDREGTVELAMLSLPDSGGRNLLIVSITDTKTLALQTHDFLIDRLMGIGDHRVRSMSRRTLEKELENSGEFFPVPVTYALYRLARALSITPDKEKKRVADRIGGRLNIGSAGEEEKHPVLDLVSATTSRIATPTEEKRLFSEKELARIMLPEDDVREYREKIEEAMKSRLILGNKNPQQSHRGEKEYTRILVDYGEGLLSATVDIKKHPFVQFLTYRAFRMKD